MCVDLILGSGVDEGLEVDVERVLGVVLVFHGRRHALVQLLRYDLKRAKFSNFLDII
jgi:hypothetical protein